MVSMFRVCGGGGRPAFRSSQIENAKTTLKNETKKELVVTVTTNKTPRPSLEGCRVEEATRQLKRIILDPKQSREWRVCSLSRCCHPSERKRGNSAVSGEAGDENPNDQTPPLDNVPSLHSIAPR